MTDKMSEDALMALKIAFTYMPKAIEVNSYDHGDDYLRILGDIDRVREILLLNDVDPEEVEGDLRPDASPNSFY